MNEKKNAVIETKEVRVVVSHVSSESRACTLSFLLFLAELETTSNLE